MPARSSDPSEASPCQPPFASLTALRLDQSSPSYGLPSYATPIAAGGRVRFRLGQYTCWHPGTRERVVGHFHGPRPWRSHKGRPSTLQPHLTPTTTRESNQSVTHLPGLHPHPSRSVHRDRDRDRDPRPETRDPRPVHRDPSSPLLPPEDLRGSCEPGSARKGFPQRPGLPSCGLHRAQHCRGPRPGGWCG